MPNIIRFSYHHVPPEQWSARGATTLTFELDGPDPATGESIIKLADDIQDTGKTPATDAWTNLMENYPEGYPVSPGEAAPQPAMLVVQIDSVYEMQGGLQIPWPLPASGGDANA